MKYFKTPRKNAENRTAWNETSKIRLENMTLKGKVFSFNITKKYKLYNIWDCDFVT
jgi:hypothetical protein